MDPFRIGAAGVVSSAKLFRPKHFAELTTPSAASSVASRLLLMPQPSPPLRGGEYPELNVLPIRSHLHKPPQQSISSRPASFSNTLPGRITAMNVERSLDRAREAVDRCLRLAKLSEEEGRTTRTFLSPPMREAQRLIREWMEGAGLTVTIDAIGNVRGVVPGSRPGVAPLLIGSHIDTVPGAGPFDGVLGVMLGIGLVAALDGETPEFGIEVVAFSEEEGVRFHIPFL